MIKTLILRLPLCAAFLCAAQISAAQGLEQQVVELKSGNWLRQQKIYMSGKEVPQGSISAEECLNEAETELTVGHYIQKFLNGVGPDLRCNITNLSGAGGDVTADVVCVGDNGAGSDMTLNYKYGPKNIEVHGEGWSNFGSHKVPFTIAASSQYLGDCL